uniref:Uncharacterized protein n=1 Tax=Panagrolaimus davidi TaxID=227884 RepID=A0A914QZT5_9BILA
MYYLGLTCAVTVLELIPLDTYMFVIVSKWSCQLREFDILDKYDNLATKCSSEVEVIRSVCRLYSEFFKITNVEKQLEIVDKLIGIKTELKSSSEKTFFGYFALFLIYNLLGHASKLPMMDIEKYGDMMSHFSDEQYCALVIASCRIKEFKLPYDKPPFIYDYEKLPDSQMFSIVQARQACRLKTLTGSAVVVYGIPVLNQNLEKCDSIQEEESVIILND